MSKTTTSSVDYSRLTKDILDDVIEDENGTWHYICADHIKYYNVPKDKLDMAAQEDCICGIRGCNKNAEAYHDMKDVNIPLKRWYVNKHGDDAICMQLNGRVTFDALWKAICNGEDVYKLIGVADSIVRERLFAELANRMELDYTDIYNKWLAKA